MPLLLMISGECLHTLAQPITAAFRTRGLESFSPVIMTKYYEQIIHHVLIHLLHRKHQNIRSLPIIFLAKYLD
jgi:hypothetical protein